ncbi:DUF6064 family protein [Fulvimarina sp. MAC8]|uniref:DUF6064 family protein n=1 Tax=Fulvimarina sp. MAC8 TaxID=3162874 RepID=UPI0032F00604
METWATYQLQDFLLFSERVYRRLFEAQNEAWRPLPIVLTFVGIAIAAVWLFRSRKRIARLRQASWIGLIFILVFVAVTFLRSHYAPISPIASVGYWAFLGEALLLALVAATEASTRRLPLVRMAIGGLLSAVGVLVYPAIGYARTGSLAGAEWFAMAPDPTAIALLGILVMAVASRLRLVVLMIVPIVWLFLSTLTLQVFGDPVSWLLFASIALAIFAAVIPARRQSLPE